MSRDRLVAFLWPESGDERARHALAQLLYALRSDLGGEVVTGSATALRLNPDIVASDVNEFHQALARGELERAVDLVGGPFLDGFHLSGCPGFERWIEEERDRIARLAQDGVETLARRAEAAGDVIGAARCWQRLATFLPYDSRIALALMKARVAAGDPAGALRHARVHTTLLRSELEAEPDPTVAAYATELATTAPATPTRPAAQPGDAQPAHATVSADPLVEPPAAHARVARNGIPLFAAAAVVLAIVVVGSANLSRESAVSDRAWILIADVENATGDAVFDRTVPVALAAGLRQSPAVYVTAPERIRQALMRMRMPGADSALTDTLALHIARREGVAAVIVPAIARAGDGYELSARIVDPATGGVLGAVSAHALDRAAVLGAMDRLSRALRRALGESMLSVATNAVPLPRVTTPSLDALQKYADGNRAFATGKLDEARSLWEAAVAIDTGFATAHASLGMLEFWVNRQAEGDAHFERAIAHMGDLPERERIMIPARAESWRGNREASTALVRTYLVQNPDDVDALAFLAYDYLRMHRPRDAADILTRLVARDSTDPTLFINLATVEKQLGRYADALAHYRRAFVLAPELETANNNVNLEYGTVHVALGQLDSAAAAFSKLLSGDHNRRARALRSFAFLAMLQGHYAEATDRLSQALLLNRRMAADVSAIRNHLLLAAVLEQRGLVDEASEQRDSSYTLTLRTDTEPTLLFWVGKGLARGGDTERAGALLERLEARVHQGSTTDRAALEGLRGEVLVVRGSALDALQHLQQAMQIDSTRFTLESLAYATAAADSLDRAAALYEALGRGIEFGWEAQEYARTSHYWLGRTHERRGDASAAAHAYARFLEEWSDADAGLVLTQDATARLARFRLEGTR
ncbi:MAG: BTAD domain-containing putative transcriptional regulator, partial [Longimicrobiales bacterium]